MRSLILSLAALFLLLPSCGDAKAKDDLIASLERLAAENNADAIYHLGMAYHTGSGIEQDASKALELFRRSASLGSELGSYKLGCYYDGQGEGLVEGDLSIALEYKLVAAEAGYALAQQDVAALYARSGQMEEAVYWLERAVEQGWPQALMTYASIHNGAEGIEPDRVKTYAYFSLFLDREGASQSQTEWLQEFEQEMSESELHRANEIVESYQAQPTELTLRALAGQRSAVTLVEQNR